MLTNFHTHTKFSDAVDTPREMVLTAIEKGFTALGFSDHGEMDFHIYGIKDTDGYINEITALKNEFKDKIQIYLGIEEEALCKIDRSRFEYMIGSYHHLYTGGNKYAVDIPNEFKQILDFYKNDIIKMTEDYYSGFYNYVINRKPDIIGHLDLLTKFDDNYSNMFSKNTEYNKIAEKYAELFAKTGIILEVNTGAISRGYKTSPYPAENLLKVLKNNNAKLTISSIKII